MYLIIFLYFFHLLSAFDIESSCSSMTYGKYCGIGHSSKFGERPVDDLDEICHKHDVCTAVGITDKWCNCQMTYQSMNFNTKKMKPEAEEMRQCMIYYGAYSCGVSTFYSNGYDTDILIPVATGWNYFTIFVSNDEIIHIKTNDTMYYNLFDEYESYLFYTILAADDPNVFKNIGKPFIKLNLGVTNGTILVISNHKSINKIHVIQSKEEYIINKMNKTIEIIGNELQTANDSLLKNKIYIADLENKFYKCETYSDKISGMIIGCISCSVICLIVILMMIFILLCTACCLIYKKRK